MKSFNRQIFSIRQKFPIKKGIVSTNQALDYGFQSSFFFGEREFVVTVRGVADMTGTCVFINAAVANSWSVHSDVCKNCLGIDVFSVSSYLFLNIRYDLSHKMNERR